MNKLSKIILFFKSLIMISIGLILAIAPEGYGYYIVSIIIGTMICLDALKNIIYYFTSAKNMVGGGRILIFNVVKLDFVSFIVLLRSSAIAMLYLVSIFMIDGVIDLLRSYEIYKNESKRWIIKFLKGLLTIGIGVTCIVFINNTDLVVLIFGIGWVLRGIEGIASAFAKTSIIYFK